MRELAERIIAKHIPTDASSLASCKECRQYYWGASEATPMWPTPIWPCDARRLADLVLS